MVSPLILTRLIRETWAPWRPTSISHLIISLKSGSYNREIPVIKLDGREEGGGEYILFEESLQAHFSFPLRRELEERLGAVGVP